MVTRGFFHKKLTTFVNLLKKKGVKAEHRVLMTVSPSVDFYALAVAVFAIGGVVVLVNPGMELVKINHCIKLAKPDVWLCSCQSWLRWMHLVIPSLRGIPLKVEFDRKLFIYEPVGGVHTYLSPLEVESVDHALITFTTGSTGMPKLLLRKHEFLMNQSKALSHSKLLMDPLYDPTQDTQFTNLPVFQLDALKMGSMGILQQRISSLNPAEAVATIDKYNVTLLGGSPHFVASITEYCVQQGRKLPSKYLITGGGPVYRHVAQNMCKVVSDPRFAVITYGSTEAEPISFISVREKVELESTGKLGLCVGRPVVEDSVRVIRINSPLDEGTLEGLDVGRDVPGEIVVSGWHVNTYQVPQTRIVVDSSNTKWLRTEDAGYLDEEGRIWLVGRVKWMVERNGKTTWSFDVEQRVYDACPSASFVTYLSQGGTAWLFIEAPDGKLSEEESKALHDVLEKKGFVVDELRIVPHIKKDQRHNSKPDTGALFKKSSIAASLINVLNVFYLVMGPFGVLVVAFLVALLAYTIL